jgi:hypothetical protein
METENMKLKVIIFSICIVLTINLFGQTKTRTIKGTVISEDLDIIAGARIQSKDKVLFGTTDINGKFTIEILTGVDSLMIGSIGMEWKSIKVPINCDNLEIILMCNVTYDFMSEKKIKRDKIKRERKLTEIRRKAFQMTIFKMEQPCE